MKEYFLYRHVRLDTNQPFYVGIGTKPKNYYGHKTEFKRAFVNYRRSKFWHSVTSKSDYRVDILFESQSLDEIKEKETEFIQLYGRRDDQSGTLVNLTDGGELHHQQAMKYKRNFKLSKEAVERISKANTGRKASEETRKILSDFHKDRGSVKRLQTEEAQQKAKQARRDNSPRVKYMETGKIYNSLIDACEELNLNYVTEHKRVKKYNNTSVFKFIDKTRSPNNKL